MTKPDAAPGSHRTPGLDSTTKIVLFSVALAGLAGALALVGIRGHGAMVGSFQVAWPLLALGFVLADTFAVHIELRDNAHSFTMIELPLMIGLFLCPPEQMILARMVGMVVALVFVRRQRLLKSLFNFALGTLETVALIAVFLAIVNPLHTSGAAVWAAAIAAAIVVNLIQSLAITIVIGLSGAAVGAGVAARMAGLGALTAVAMASLGIVSVMVTEVNPVGLALVSAVAGLMYVAYRGYAMQAQRYGNLENLYELTRKLACAPSLEDSMRFTLEEACELVRAEQSELALLEGNDDSTGTVRVRLTKARELQMIAEPFDNDVVHAAVMATQAAVVIPRTTTDPAQRRYLAENHLVDLVAVPVFQGGTIVGTLAAHNRLGDVSTFDNEDAKIFSTLAHHVGTALDNARLIERLRTEVAQKEHQALHDTLTGLGNRDLFAIRADAALRESQAGGWQVAIMLMDLNRFKDVNDTLGHHHGDLLLQQVAERVTHAMPKSATIARLGGDEFALLLLPQIRSVAEAEHAAVAVQTALQHPFVVGRVQLAVNAAIGISVAPAHGVDVSTLLQHADIAMYNAKDSRDAGVEIYDADHNRHSTRRLTLAAQLQTAIIQRELEVHYQPKADLRTGHIVGVEALARWQHPQHGAIPPDEFVELAESTGLMRQMTTLVLDLALEQIHCWHEIGLEFPVAVNLSARSLLEVDLAEQLAAMCRTHSVSPRQLILEITETQMMADPQRTISLLERVAELGIQVSIDDFGTGYSSLAYLQRLPVHEIKVDKSFVNAMTADDTNTKIVRSIIDLGHSLQLRVVAEGVEDRCTWDTLHTLGCDIAQGYYLSRPLPAQQLTPWLQQQFARPSSIPA